MYVAPMVSNEGLFSCNTFYVETSISKCKSSKKEYKLKLMQSKSDFAIMSTL